MKKQAINKTDEILSSLDGVKKIKAPGFFYTRLKARMERSLVPHKQNSRILRPAYAIAFLILLVAFNIISILKQNNDSSTTNNETENSQSLSSAYNLENNLTYELNQ